MLVFTPIKKDELASRIEAGCIVRRSAWPEETPSVFISKHGHGYSSESRSLPLADILADDWVGAQPLKVFHVLAGKLSFFEAVAILNSEDASEYVTYMSRACWTNSNIACPNGELCWVEDHLEKVSLALSDLNAEDWIVSRLES